MKSDVSSPVGGRAPRDRIEALERKAQTLEIWLKVAFSIAAFLGISGVYLFQRAKELTASYIDLTQKQGRLEARVSELDKELNQKAVAALQKAAPEVLRAGIKASIDGVNERINGLTLIQSLPMADALQCQDESRPDEHHPDQIVTMVGQRDCFGKVGGATYYKFLSLQKPPVK